MVGDPLGKIGTGDGFFWGFRRAETGIPGGLSESRGNNSDPRVIRGDRLKYATDNTAFDGTRAVPGMMEIRSRPATGSATLARRI